MKKKSILILIPVIAVFSLFFVYNADSVDNEHVFAVESVTSAGYGNAANFTWKHGSKTVSFKDYTKDKVVFLNFFGTWCGPCKRELPDIVEIGNDLKDKDFIIVAVALERNQSTALKTVSEFAKARNLPFLIVIDDDKRSLSNAYGGISAVPTTFIIDKAGKIAQTKLGMGTKQQFMDLINKVL